MIFVSVTRLRIRKLRYLPGFFLYAARSVSQAKRAEGVVTVKLVKGAGLVFWTITLWRDEKTMRQFRNSGAHLKVMPRLANWCDEATYVHWIQESETPPTPAEAHMRLTSEGTVSKVFHPSPAHASRNFPPFKKA